MSAYDKLKTELESVQEAIAERLTGGLEPTTDQQSHALRIRAQLIQMDIDRLRSSGQSMAIHGRQRTEVDIKALREELAAVRRELGNLTRGGMRVRQAVPYGC